MFARRKFYSAWGPNHVVELRFPALISELLREPESPNSYIENQIRQMSWEKKSAQPIPRKGQYPNKCEVDVKAKEKMSLVDLGKRLLEASRKGQAEEVSVLMGSGAPFTTDWLGTSPLHLAAQHGHTQTAEVLLRAGVSRDARTKVDRTPLHMAAQHGHTSVVELLVSSGASVNTKDMLSMTPLHWACEHNHLDIIKLLLRSGAQTDIRSKFGKLPGDIAKQKGYTQAVLLMTEHMDDPGERLPTLKREAEKNNLALTSLRLKRQRTKKFPMTAGSWTGTEGPVESGNKQRKKATTPTTSQPKSAMANGRRVSAPAQYPSAGSPSLRSPTENSIASLVSAAALVKAKAESEGSQGNKQGSSSTTAQDSSVLDTLATLATATLSHGTTATSTSSAPHVATISGRAVSVTPLTLPPNTPTSVLSGLTTPLTPGGSLFPLPSPLVALSALSSLSSPIQTSPLPSFAMSPMGFSLPVSMTSAQVASLVQGNSSANVSTALTTTPTSSVDASTTGPSAAQAHSQSFIPQQFAMAPFQIVGGPGGPQQLTLTPSGALLTQLAAGQPNVAVDLGSAASKETAAMKTDVDAIKAPVPSVVVELGNGGASKEGVGKAEDDPCDGQSDMSHDTGSEPKTEELGSQNPQNATQDIIVTLQVPAALQQLQQQLLSDQAFPIPQIQLLQQLATGQDQGGAPQQTQTSAQISHGQVAQPQFTIVQAPQVQVTDGSSQDQPSTTTSQTAQVVQFQLPQGALPPATALQAPTSQEHVAGTTQLTQTSLGAQPQAAVSQTQQKSPQQQQTAQQQISQQLLTQSIPQGAGASQALQGLLQQNYAAQFGQVQVQASIDPQQQQQQQQQQTPQMLLQVQQDIRKMLERRQVEEDRSRKELEGKLMALQKDSDKYRSELQQAQREAESYRDRLEEEVREKTRLHQLYQASKNQQAVDMETEVSIKAEPENDGLSQP